MMAPSIGAFAAFDSSLFFLISFVTFLVDSTAASLIVFNFPIIASLSKNPIFKILPIIHKYHSSYYLLLLLYPQQSSDK